MTEVLFTGDHLRAEVHNPQAEVLFVTFDRWRRDRNGFAEWQPSTKVAEHGFAELIIKTAQNDWYLDADLGPLRRVLKDHTGRYRTVRSFAFSMGAYAALLLSRVLRLRHAVLISPQYCVFPNMAPGDRRYVKEAERLDQALGHLAEVVAPKLRWVVLFDPMRQPIDRDHARLILNVAPRMSGVALPLGGHPASQILQETAAYGGLRALAFAGQSDPALYHALHVQARARSPLYKARLAERLADRQARLVR